MNKMSFLSFYFLLTACIASLGVSESASAEEKISFDHFRTGFPLEGAHERVECEDCHPKGNFRGTPMNCEECHSDRGLITASSKSLNHINSSDRCDNCHVLTGWETVVRVDHSDVRGNCSSCHFPGGPAPGKNPGHILSSDSCEDCHSTNFFSPVVRVDHNAFIAGSRCDSCHNGITAEGVDDDHIPIGNTDCNACHTTQAWIPTTLGNIKQSLDNYMRTKRKDLP
ncbi:MAG: cytochrome c3 family protein [Pseudomonadota bacterium]